MTELRLMKLQQLRSLRAEKARREAETLAQVDVFAKLGYEPICKPRMDARAAGVPESDLPAPCGQCPQEQFHAATEDDVLYGGAAGGGKTCALCMEGVRAAVRYPGIRVLALRRSYDELAESFFPELARFNWAEAVGGHWNGTERELRFRNGSVIRFRYMESLADATRRQGGAYQLLLVDERTLMTPGVVDVIALERLRTRGNLPVLGVRSSCNPGGPSHGEVLERYIEATEYGAKTVVDENGLTQRFIPAKATDNPYLDAAYHRRLDSIKDPARRAAMRDGAWDQFSGQMFREYRRDRHVLAPVTLPAGWKRFNGVDWGFSKPWAVLWAAVDEDGRVWVYREIYDTLVGESEQALRILGAEGDGERVTTRWADDAMWATRGEAKPIADVYAENGVYLTPAGKGAGSRVNGWQRWHSYLAEGPTCPHHRALGWESCPKIHIFDTCPKLVFELKNLPYATTGNPEDADTNAPDHAMDAGRYLLTNLGTGPEFPILDAPKPPGLPEVAPTATFVVVPSDRRPPAASWFGDDGAPKPGGVVTL